MLAARHHPFPHNADDQVHAKYLLLAACRHSLRIDAHSSDETQGCAPESTIPPLQS
jgi:hypothetical protein